MKHLVAGLIVIISALDVSGLIELPLFASIGIFVAALLIVLDVVFEKSDPKDES